MKLSESEELARVMDEIRDVMGAETTILTGHDDDAPIRVMFPGTTGEALRLALLQRLRTDAPVERDMFRWFEEEVDGTRFQVLAMPVQPVPSHARLLICAVFTHLDDMQRAIAEEAYLKRRPFAVGYFRLLQLDHTRARRIAALEAALDRSEFGVVLLDREARAVFANESAKLILEAEDGLRRHRGGIVATALHDAMRLRTGIEHVLHSGGSTQPAPLLMLNRREKPPLVVSILPMNRQAEESTDVAAIVYILDPSLDSERLLQPICKLYHLSPVETRLACLLADGATLADAAAIMHVKEQTARSCLKQVFIKTNTNRQADLIRTLLQSTVRTNRFVQFEAF